MACALGTTSRRACGASSRCTCSARWAPLTISPRSAHGVVGPRSMLAAPSRRRPRRRIGVTVRVPGHASLLRSAVSRPALDQVDEVHGRRPGGARASAGARTSWTTTCSAPGIRADDLLAVRDGVSRSSSPTITSTSRPARAASASSLSCVANVGRNSAMTSRRVERDHVGGEAGPAPRAPARRTSTAGPARASRSLPSLRPRSTSAGRVAQGPDRARRRAAGRRPPRCGSPKSTCPEPAGAGRHERDPEHALVEQLRVLAARAT